MTKGLAESKIMNSCYKTIKFVVYSALNRFGYGFASKEHMPKSNYTSIWSLQITQFFWHSQILRNNTLVYNNEMSFKICGLDKRKLGILSQFTKYSHQWYVLYKMDDLKNENNEYEREIHNYNLANS